MARSKNKAKSEPNREHKRYRVEFTRAQLMVYALGLIAALTWMFVFGILVGRGIPLTAPGDSSFKGQIAHLLGLDRAREKARPEASKTWKTPEEMLQSLTYHEDLKGASGQPGSPPAPPSETGAPNQGSVPAEASHYVLMVSSLRNKDNADMLISQLKAKGYAPRMEAVQMAEAGLWYRVLIGRFGSRQEAQQFAAAFNQKENMQGLVIQVDR